MLRPERAVPGVQESSSASRWFGWPGVVLVLCVVAATYAPQLEHPFQFDDDAKVVSNPRVRDPALLAEDFELGKYSEAVTRLLPNLSLALDFAWFGMKPFGFNITNLFFHLCNIALLFMLARALAARLKGVSAHFAWLSAALFGLHPLNSEAVYYCNARPNLMLTTFYLAALYLLIASLEAPRDKPLARIACWIGFAASSLAALLCKEIAITLLIIAPVLVYWLSLGESEGESELYVRWRARGPMLAIGLGVVGGAMFFLTGAFAAVTRFLSQRSLSDLALIFADQSTIVFRYLGLWLLPLPGFLNLDHSALGHLRLRMHAGGSVAMLVWPVLATLLLLFGMQRAWRNRKRWPVPTFAIFFAAITHAPLWVMPRGEAMVEYRTYLPMVGLCMLLAFMLEPATLWLCERFEDPSRSLQRASYGVLLASFCVATVVRGQAWSSPERMWRDVLSKAPSTARAYLALGEISRERQDLDAAIAFVDKAVQLDPSLARAHSTLGTMLAAHGDLLGGKQSLMRGFALDPNDYQAANNIGNVLSALQQTDLAKRYYLEALAIQPVFAEAELNLAQIERKLGHLEAAMPHYRRALQLAPHLPVVYLMFGRAQLDQGQTRAAIETWKHGLAIDPRQPAMHAQLATALIGIGQRDAAIAHLRIAFDLAPENPDVVTAMKLAAKTRPGR